MKKYKELKKRNPLARDLWSPKYRMRVVEDKRGKVRDKFDKREMKRDHMIPFSYCNYFSSFSMQIL